MDNVLEAHDKYGRDDTHGNTWTRTCTPRYDNVIERQCRNNHVYQNGGDGRLAVQRVVPQWCNMQGGDKASEFEPTMDKWPRPTFDCKDNQGVSAGDRIGNRLKMTYDQCLGYFTHEEWSFVHDKSSNSCWRVKENARTSGAGWQWKTCKKTRSGNPIVGSDEEKQFKEEIANGDYVKGTLGTDECPEGSEVVDDQERCWAAAKKFGLEFKGFGYWETSPKGCMIQQGVGVHLNREYESSAISGQARICERGAAPPVSWWGSEQPDTTHECGENCREWWRGDKRCDAGCNIASCNWDDGDCGAGCKWNCPGSESYIAQARSLAMHAAPKSEVPLPVTVFAAVGFVATLYGAFKHFTK